MKPAAASVAWMALLLSTVAHANGAFPDSMQILLPEGKPSEIAVGANFGLLLSQDAGKTWSFVCEEAIGPCARLYQATAPPSDTITAIANGALAVLTDNACTQRLGGGLVVGTHVVDAFADPTDPNHVLAIAITPADGGGDGAYGLYESRDGGNTFSTQLFEAPDGLLLTGIENARSDARTVYLTGFRSDGGYRPFVLHSADGGNTFDQHDLSAGLGATRIALAAVDPLDATKLYLRVTDPATQVDALAISEDAGVTASSRVSFPASYQMRTFLRGADGTIYVSGLLAGAESNCGVADLTANAPVSAFKSSDGGKTFAPWTSAPHARALGERDGVIYVVGDNFIDGYAVGRSSDHGASFEAVLRFDQIGPPQACVSAACAASWATIKATLGIVDPKPDAPGCGCDLGGRERRERGASLAGLGLVVALALWARRARRGTA